jgi:SnoaL-like domain
MCDACRVPWVPELFSAPILHQLEDKWGHQLVTVPFFDGVMTGDLDALVGSFAGEPELHHPVRGRIRGARAFERYATETKAWLNRSNVSVDRIEQVVLERHGFAEVVLHLDGETGRFELPVAVVSDRGADGRIEELRIYYSTWPFTGRHANRPPLLQRDPTLRESDVVAEHQDGLSAGDVDAVVATFEPDGYAREPAGGQYVHKGREGLRAFYELLFSNDGGIPLEHCALIDDGRACALEYNVVRWGKTELPPEAGVVVYVRGESGKLAAARIYDDVNPPIGPPQR